MSDQIRHNDQIPLDQGPRHQWADEVMQVVGTLDRSTAEALMLFYRYRLTLPQLALQLGLPELEVKFRVADGLRKLGQVMRVATP